MKLVMTDGARLTAHILPKKAEAKKTDLDKEKMTPLAFANRQFIDGYKKSQQNQDGKLSGIMDQITLGKKMFDLELKNKGNYSSPLEYQKALFMKEEREYYKKLLKQCRSKEEVRKLRNQKMNEFMMEIRSVERAGMDKETKETALEYIRQRIEGINEEHKEFTEKGEYQRLPEKVKEDEKKRLMRELLQARNPKEPDYNMPKKKDVVEDAKADIAQRRENGEFEFLAATTDTPKTPERKAPEKVEASPDSAPQIDVSNKPVFDIKA